MGAQAPPHAGTDFPDLYLQLDIEAWFIDLNSLVEEREGSRVLVQPSLLKRSLAAQQYWSVKGQSGHSST